MGLKIGMAEWSMRFPRLARGLAHSILLKPPRDAASIFQGRTPPIDMRKALSLVP
jgi:hypothetical protein